MSVAPVVVSANSVSLAISPSKIYDECIEPGSTKSYVFNVSNNSDIEADMAVEVKATLEDQYGGPVESTNVLSFDKTELSVKPKESTPITVTLNVPNGFPLGNYIVYVNYVPKPLEGSVLGARTPAIKVPLYVYVGAKKEYDLKEVKYEVLSNALKCNQEPTTIKGEVIKNCKKALNPFNAIDVINGIIDRPLFNFNIDDETILDVNNNIYTSLRNVATTEDNLSSSKYVHYDGGCTEEKVKDIKVTNSQVVVILDSDNEVVIKGCPSTLESIKSQLQGILATNKSPTLRHLLDYLQVPKNSEFEKADVSLVSTIQNSSEVPITIKGAITTLKNNSETVFTNSVTFPTLKSNEVKDFQTTILAEELTDGIYSTSGNLEVKSVKENLNLSFKVEKKRDVILKIVVGFLVGYFLVAVILLILVTKIIKRIVKKIKNKKGGIIKE